MSRVPEKPGVYIMHDKNDGVLYVGKAIVLKNRLKSYFSSSPHSARITSMISRIERFEYIVCGSELEALLLENNLIKKYKPKYNVLLKDDKGYPYIKVTLGERFPRAMLARQIDKDGARYFGPYFSGFTVKQVLETLEGIVPLRTCRKKFPKDGILADRPCLNYHMGHCRGVCAGRISDEEYGEMVDLALDFLSGDTAEAEKRLKASMLEASENLEFEQAAVFRNRLKALAQIKEKQKTSLLSNEDFDAIAAARNSVDACVQIFFIRGGRMLGREFFIFDGAADASEAELTEAFIRHFYNENQFIPSKIYIDAALEDETDEAGNTTVTTSSLIERSLEAMCGHRVRLIVPVIGEKKKMCLMVRENAAQALENREKAAVSGKPSEREARALSHIQEIFSLPKLPVRIESYDVSNQGDSEINGSMVVFVGGKPSRTDYRLFKMKLVKQRSDTDSMTEMLDRRLKRYAENSRGFDTLPDLILADGGITQVNAVIDVLRKYGITVPVLGMVKDDRHRSRALAGPESFGIQHDGNGPLPLTRADSTEFDLRSDPDIWRFITAVQDETHRVAVTYNRKLTGKRYTKSALDDIPGVGKKRKMDLFRHFGSIAAVKNASVEELSAVDGVGRKRAEMIYSALHPDANNVERLPGGSGK